ncbi:hypothetical protein M407DRAFT_23062 [Tulasnella calospora MUT 4182]|uniref:Uncharacterized protein n=1 Tax=Tulasnella calospora MUT 4182 TaxID=1051891 RepID=A0A0C3QLY4_9AGAM|nr:hypothetical protein M407DRAFT_23062 [Tulasnella calospora MUT 4182]
MASSSPKSFRFVEPMVGQLARRSNQLQAEVTPYLKYLNLCADQLSAIQSLYEKQKTLVKVYHRDEDPPNTLPSQLDAAALLAENGLSVTEPMGLGGRWKKKWCTTWEKGKGKKGQNGGGGSRAEQGQATKSSGDGDGAGLSITRALYQWQATSCIMYFLHLTM